jgi:hypothetical protein
MPARRVRVAALALAILMGGGPWLCARASRATEIPQVQPGAPPASATPQPTPIGPVLPQGSVVELTLDREVKSGSVKPGASVTLHVKEPVIVNGVTVADQSSWTTVHVVAAHGAGIAMADGDMQIQIDPLPLLTGGTLPLRLTHELLSVNHTAGELATQDTMDMAGMLLFPPYLIFRVLRKGQNVDLPAGSTVRVFTSAAIDAHNPNAVVVAAPHPLVVNNDPVHSEYSPAPFVTAPTPTPRRTPTPKPSPTPAPSPSSAAQPAAPSPSAS